MSHVPFIELHARSAFSFLQGTDYPPALVRQAVELGMGALALCDRSGFQGAPRFFTATREAGIRAIVGTELPMEDGTSLPVLVASRTGYQNLCQLLTRAKLRVAKGEESLAWSELEEFAGGVHCLTGDRDGPVQGHLVRGDLEAAEKATQRLVRIFGQKSVHVEAHRYRVRGEERVVRALRDLAEHLSLPLIASNAPVAATPDNRPLLDAFTCLRHHTNLDHAGDLLDPNAQRYLKGPREMAALFADLPEALENTVRLADQLDFSLQDLGYQFPRYPTGEGETQSSILRRETYAGARNRYPRMSRKVKAQLEHELDLIDRLGFSGYFLIVWDIVRFTKDQGMLAQGRGSAANSAVCYSLGITNVDPVGGELLFERFLSEGREGWPDIDIDLPSGPQRESVIQEVYRRFGRRGAAMTANVITYRSRSAMREMGKVLDLPSDVLGRFSDVFGRGGMEQDNAALREQLRKSGLPPDHPRVPALVTLLRAVKGLPRHLGQHSGGMIISDRGLDKIVPLENATMPGRSIVQWDKDDCEDLGIIKVDLLGLGMMAAIEETIQLCADRGRPVDLAHIPKDDPETYAMLCRADTIGLFQVESRAQQACLPRMQPKVFYDVVIQTALIRPGPIVGNLVHPYLNRRRGTEPITYIDDRFIPALKRTLGIPLFQEQVLRMAMVIADFTGSEAEELRRALSFNRSQEKMDLVMEKLRTAMTRKTIQPDKQEQIIDSIRSFALYGFPESHAISFALLAYASAWLKVHRTAEFYVGLLNHQPMGFYSPSTLLEDARRWGIRVRPVSITDSQRDCTVLEDKVIRIGLKMVRGVTAATIEKILQARDQSPFTDLDDLLRRVRMPKPERRILARTGVLAPLTAHRRDALWRIESAPEEDDLFTWAATAGHQDQGKEKTKDRVGDKNKDSSNPNPNPDALPLVLSSVVQEDSPDYTPKVPAPRKVNIPVRSEALKEPSTPISPTPNTPPPAPRSVDIPVHKTSASPPTSATPDPTSRHPYPTSPIPHLAPPPSDPSHPSSDPTSHHPHPTSRHPYPTSPIPHLAPPPSDPSHPSSDPTSHHPHPTSHHPHPESPIPPSDISHPPSDIRHPSSDIRHPSSDPSHPPSDIRPPISPPELPIPNSKFTIHSSSTPLPPMSPADRLQADFAAMRLTTGPHPMAYIRPTLPKSIRTFTDLATLRDGQHICVAGMVICRQRPSTAKGHMFISLEDETGITNVFVPSKTYERFRLIISQEPFLKIKGRLQDQEGVMSVYTLHIEGLPYERQIASSSHDFC